MRHVSTSLLCVRRYLMIELPKCIMEISNTSCDGCRVFIRIQICLKEIRIAYQWLSATDINNQRIFSVDSDKVIVVVFIFAYNSHLSNDDSLLHSSFDTRCVPLLPQMISVGSCSGQHRHHIGSATHIVSFEQSQIRY